MDVISNTIQFQTQKETQIVDLTEKIQQIVKQSKINKGIINVFLPGSTGAITTLEYEPGLIKDLPAALERLFPKSIPYEHHKTWHDDNGHSHVRASIIGQSFTAPIVKNRIELGTWQQIVFIELDTRPRTRRLILQIIGKK